MIPPARTESGPPDDAYAALLSQTRGLKREQLDAREAWYSGLAVDRKGELLFELEVLLKGLACFANPRNHPGRPRRAPAPALDYARPLERYGAGLRRVVALTRQLLGHSDRSLTFQRYLLTALPEDEHHSRTGRDEAEDESPEQALFALRHALGQLSEIARGMERLSPLPYRTFFALTVMAQREIAHNAYFNPLFSLEFRPEFDRIRATDIVGLIAGVNDARARRLAALTFLSLFRLRKYLDLIESVLSAPASEGADTGIGSAFLIASVLRSDARALANYLRTRSGPLLSEGFEVLLFSTPASKMKARYDELHAEGQRLLSIRRALFGIAASLRLEIRRSFEHDMPALDADETEEVSRARFRHAAEELRPALESIVLFFARSLDVGVRQVTVLEGEGAERRSSERLRRDVWMFAQVVRAFGAKAEHARADDDRWSATTKVAFVKDFSAYFQALGYPLLRATDYPRMDAFLGALDALEDTDLVDPTRLARAVDEAHAFHGFLMDLVEQIGKRAELRSVPFDKRRAAEALRLYLCA